MTNVHWNWSSVLLWSFAATIVLTTSLGACRGFGLTRMDVPFMLGTIFTANRDRAKWIGFFFHFLNGWVFSLIYIAAFISTGIATWWFGMAIGVVHALFVLIVVMGLLPSVHPRMASEQYGPDVTRMLEPPGFLALHYGRETPLATLIAHMIYGAILGGFYR